MVGSLGVRAVDLNVVITAYLLALSVFIPVSGWLADRFGARIVFGTAIVVCTVASGLCALSTSSANSPRCGSCKASAVHGR